MTDTARERDAALENAERYANARDSGHLDFVKKARRCEAFFHGYENKQWDPSVAAQLKSQRKPVLTINKIFPTLSTVMGEQLQNQVDISFRAANGGDPDVATALDKTWVYLTNENHLDWVRSEVADDGFIKSRGFFDVRVLFDNNLTGDIVIRRENPYNVVLSTDDSSYDPDNWNEVFLTKWVTGDNIRLLYGKKEAAKTLEERTSSNIPSLGYDFLDSPAGTFGRDPSFTGMTPEHRKTRRIIRLIERQYKEMRRVEHFVDPQTGEFRVIPDTWDRNRIAHVVEQTGVAVMPAQARIIRWVVSADDFLLFDEVSPYKHYTIVPFFPQLRDGETIGLVENLLSPQENLNKTRSQELHIVNTTSNSGWKVKTGTLQNMSIYDLEERGAETGLVLELDDIAGVDKIQPNQVPTGLDRISFKSDEDIKQISNVGDSQRGMDRADVSGVAIEKKQVRGAVNLAKPFSNLIRSDHMVARNTLDLIQTFMTEERVLVITGRDPEQSSEEVTVNEITPEGGVLNDLTLGEYSVMTTVVPLREQQEDSVFEQMATMRGELGIEIGDSFILENSRLPNKRAIIEALQEGSAPRQRMEELEIEEKEADIEKTKTESIARRADSVEKVARAKKTAQEGEADPTADPELMLKQRQIDGELQLKQRQMDGELKLKQEQSMKELSLKQEQIRREHLIRTKELALEEKKVEAEIAIKEKAANAATKLAAKKAAETPKPAAKPSSSK